jgi:hypothetical protein
VSGTSLPTVGDRVERERRVGFQTLRPNQTEATLVPPDPLPDHTRVQRVSRASEPAPPSLHCFSLARLSPLPPVLLSGARGWPQRGGVAAVRAGAGGDVADGHGRDALLRHHAGHASASALRCAALPPATPHAFSACSTCLCLRSRPSMRAMTHWEGVWHAGSTNARLTAHMGFIVPDGCSIRAGTEWREWQVGKCIVFDDSFEHEVRGSWRSSLVLLVLLTCCYVCPACCVRVPASPHRRGGGASLSA